MFDDLEITKMLTVSTSHIKNYDLMWKLEKDEAILKSQTGVFLFVNDNDWEDLSTELKQLAAICRTNGCSHLRIDGDGPEIEGINTFNW